MQTYIFLSALLILVVFFLKKYYDKINKEEYIPTNEKIVKLELKGNQKKNIFFKIKNWGIAGNHEEIVLSETKNDFKEQQNDYIFYTPEIYYKIENDHIILRAPESSIIEPKIGILKKIIILKPLNSFDEINNFDKNYKSLGFNKISIYDKKL